MKLKFKIPQGDRLAIFLASFGALGIIFFVLLTFTLAFGMLGLSIYGIVLAFKASLILGLLVLLIEPTPLLLGFLAVIGHPEIAQLIARWLGL